MPRLPCVSSRLKDASRSWFDSDDIIKEAAIKIQCVAHTLDDVCVHACHVQVGQRCAGCKTGGYAVVGLGTKKVSVKFHHAITCGHLNKPDNEISGSNWIVFS